jgi:imidazolonepropionase-like amidohydrolase
MPDRRRASLRLIPLLAIIGLPAAASAQMRPTLIRDATILTGDGQTIAGDLLIQGDKIGALGPNIDAPFLAKKVRGKGKFITPGLIDVCSTLGVRAAGASDNPTARALDSFDRFDSDAIRDALAHGVTTICIPALSREGVGGVAAVVRLIPGGEPADITLDADFAMCATLGGLSNQGTFGRIGAAVALRRMLDEAKQYREAQDFYKEDLEEYEKKIKERAEKEAAGKPADGPKTDTPPPSKPEPPRPAQPSDRPRRRPPRPGTAFLPGAAPVESLAVDDSPAGAFAEGEPPAKPDEARKDEIQKPPAPPREAAKEALLRVLDGELPLRVTADRPEDILNALEIAEEFNVRLIIDGGTGAHLVADRLAEREIPVVLRAPAPPQRFIGGAWRYHDDRGVATLLQAGVTVYCASGAAADSPTRQLALRAAQLAGHAAKPDDALAWITSRAARLLELDERLGRLAPGMAADLVIWTAHPLSPEARVERVFINGQEVYRAGESDKDDDS